MRTKSQIAADPNTPQQELLDLAIGHPREIALNPNSPIEALALYSTLDACIWLVEQNPVWPLLRLEDPILYKKTWEDFDGWWISKASDRSLSRRFHRKLIALYAEHVLDLVSPPSRPTVQEMIQLLRDYGDYHVDAAEFKERQEAINARYALLRDDHRATQDQQIIQSTAAMVAALPLAGSAARAANDARLADGGHEARQRERQWQADQIRILCANDPVLRREMRVE